MFLNKNLKKGELLANKVISILRPKIGLDQMIYKVIGKKPLKDLKILTNINLECSSRNVVET